MMQKVNHNGCSEYVSLAQETCKRLATANEVSALFLRKVK
ncbi:hypothetical protein PLUTE_a5318 [Pseudoalteromonas luteoviolacea DSM 6061]|nr:hypothetical protein [Pseudoalteromonas luteoviolacea DSM 6061]